MYSIIQKSQLEGAHRLDAEYYQPEYIEKETTLRSFKFERLDNIADKIFSGPFGSTLKSESYQSEGVPFVRIADISDLFISREGLVYISEAEHQRIYSTHLNVGDIILSKIGTVGRLSVIDEPLVEVNISENNIGIRLQNKNANSRAYLLFFLLSSFGQFQILRRASGNIQLKLNVDDINGLIVPVFDKDQYRYFENFYEQIKELYDFSRRVYRDAEDLLLQKLSMDVNDLDNNLLSAVNFSDIQNAHRMDAEFFQPKYEHFIAQCQKKDVAKLGDMVSVTKGAEPGSEAYEDEGKPFLRVSNMSKFGLTDNNQKYVSDKIYKELIFAKPEKGDILLTKDATPGIAYVLKDDIDGIISGGVVRMKIKSKKVDPEYLALCLNSQVGQMQIERSAGGSIIKHWKPSEIKETLIPMLPLKTQKKIADLVRQSFDAREKAKKLLAEAKRKVEEMIESTS